MYGIFLLFIFATQNAKISMQAWIKKMITCFVTPAVLKVLKLGEQSVNYYKIYDNSD